MKTKRCKSTKAQLRTDNAFLRLERDTLQNELDWALQRLDTLNVKEDMLRLRETLDECRTAGRRFDTSIYGGCPRCGEHDGYVNTKGGTWFICTRHNAKWFCDAPPFDVAPDIDDLFSRRNTELLESYHGVAAMFPPEHFENGNTEYYHKLPTALRWAAIRVLDAIWEDALCDYRHCLTAAPEKAFENHVFVSLVQLRSWLDEEPQLSVEHFTADLSYEALGNGVVLKAVC